MRAVVAVSVYDEVGAWCCVCCGWYDVYVLRRMCVSCELCVTYGICVVYVVWC